MGRVIIQSYTTEKPITLIGAEAGVCYGSDTTSNKKNYRRGLKNISSGHGRTLEFPQVYIVFEGYSARVMRELYTHIGGGPTRLQASTRYIEYGEFEYIVPPTIAKNPNAVTIYKDIMHSIGNCYRALERIEDIPKEDIANILPLGMTSTVVCRTNLRNLIDMAHQRTCNRAYWEFRELMQDLKIALSEYSDEWKYIVDNYFIPKCEVCGFCTEEHSCGRKPARKDT